MDFPFPSVYKLFSSTGPEAGLKGGTAPDLWRNAVHLRPFSHLGLRLSHIFKIAIYHVSLLVHPESRKELTRYPHQLCTCLFDRNWLPPLRCSSRLTLKFELEVQWLRKHHLAPLRWSICVTYCICDVFTSHDTFDFWVYM